MTSALRESAGPRIDESEQAGSGGPAIPDEALAQLLSVSFTAPPLRLAGDPDEDDGEVHICRSID